jgi:CDGSH-type Zn-finger protein
MEPGTYYWCSCGRSANQPFCDGSHGETGFVPLAVAIPQAKAVAWGISKGGRSGSKAAMEIAQAMTLAWCACKHTKTPPFCDGSHAHLK